MAVDHRFVPRVSGWLPGLACLVGVVVVLDPVAVAGDATAPADVVPVPGLPTSHGLSNGRPLYGERAPGASKGEGNLPPTITGTKHEPVYPSDDDQVVISWVVQDDSGVDLVSLFINVGGGWAVFDIDGDDLTGIYEAIVPPLADDTQFDYFILAIDDSGDSAADPPGAPDDVYSYVVGQLPPGTRTPVDGAELSATHMLFTFEPIAGAVGYQLQVAVDVGVDDPFQGPPAVDVEMNRARRIVTSGLGFGENYAWRVRGLNADDEPGAWQFVHRFQLADFPDELIDIITVNNIDPESYQPGVTLLALRQVPEGAPHYGVAVDQTGQVVWFLERFISDVRMLRNGNLLHDGVGGPSEITLDGEVVWHAQLEDPDGHEAFDMPNGNIMTLVNLNQEVERDGDLQMWNGQEIIELNREWDVVWSWNPFDHIAFVDFDECLMEFPDPDGVYDWTHSNAVVYDAVDNAVYCSVRNISRIIKIDYSTGNIIWSMGFDMPSGDTDFGDDLFSFQHAPEVQENGNILLYDNGNRRGHSFCNAAEPFSTAIELSIDPGAPQLVTVVWQYAHEFSWAMGDADRLSNGNTLVVASVRGHILEVAPDGTIVWDLNTVLPTIMYRAERIPSLYPLRGDANGDDDVDLLDFGDFQRCFSGTDDRAIHRDCLVHDFDEDGDVDLDDYAEHVGAATGPG